MLIFVSQGVNAVIDSGRAFEDAQLRELADAARSSDIAKIDKLVRAGVPVNGIGREGFRPLHWALLGKSPEGLKRLLELGADPNAEIGIGRSPVFMAASLESPDFLRYLLQAGGDPNGRSTRGTGAATALSRAFSALQRNNADLLIQAGADVNAIVNGEPLIMGPIYLERFDLAFLLLQHGALFTKDYSKLVTGQICETVRLRPFVKNDHFFRKVVDILSTRGIQFGCAVL